MSKKSDYSKVFGKGKTKYDFDVKKKKKTKSHDIFFNESGKKKKKKHKKTKIDKIVKRAVGANESDDLSEFLVWEKLEDTGIDNFEDLSKNARGVFIVEVKIDDSYKAFVPVTVTAEGEVLYTETSERITKIFAQFYAKDNENVTEVDLEITEDALKRAGVIESIYNVDMNKIMESINMFSNLGKTVSF